MPYANNTRSIRGVTVTDDPALAEILSRLANAFRPDEIYIFGSKARGESDVDSDYDLMVIVPDDAGIERRKSRLAYQVLRGTGTAADVIVFTRSEFDGRLHVAASLQATVAREGKLVYAA